MIAKDVCCSYSSKSFVQILHTSCIENFFCNVVVEETKIFIARFALQEVTSVTL